MAFVATPQDTQALLALLRGAASGQAQPTGLASLFQGEVPTVDQAPAPPANWEQMVDPNTYVQQAAGPQLAPVQAEPQYDGAAIGVDGKDLIRNKSAIGIGGTFRDILGYLGDALTGRYNYANQRREEKFGNILAGKYQDNAEESFAQNPMLAIQRLSEAGYGKEASDLLQQVRQNEIANRRVAAQESRDERTTNYQKPKAVENVIEVASRALSNVRDDPGYMRLKGSVEGYLKKAAEELNDPYLAALANSLPTSYDPSLNRWGLKQYQAQRLDDYDVDRDLREEIAKATEAGRAEGRAEAARHNRASEDISQQNADSNTTRAGKAKDNSGRGRPSGSPVANALSTAISAIPPAPRRVGDRIRGPDGSRYTSPDGKRWVRQ